MSPRYLVTAMFAILLTTPAEAQSVKAGIEAWQKADYPAAVAIWRPLAQKGDADAEFNLGQAYRLGRGVPIDFGMARLWFEKAASAGHVDAETTLGLLLFQNGDQAQGLKWLRRAAEQGEPRAELVYGTALYNGDGVTQDHLLGYAFVSRAAAQGLAPAKETLAQLDGLMSEPDRKKAMLLAEAARKPAEPKLKPAPAQVSAASRPREKRSGTAAVRAEAKTQLKAEARSEAKARPAKIAAGASRPSPRERPHGDWRIQLGAFSQRSSAEALYRRLSGKSALAGRSAVYLPVGSMTRLQVGPFESRAAAEAACGALGTACFPVVVK